MKFQTLHNFCFGTLRGRLIIAVAAVHAVMMTLFIADLTMRQRAMLLDRQTEQATALSQALATSAAGWIAANDIAGLEELVDAQRRYPELIFAILTDANGQIVAATDKSRRGSYLLDLPGTAKQTLLSRTPALVDVAVPAIVGGRNVGWARIGVGQQMAVKTLSRITLSGIIYALAAIIAGSLFAWLMGKRITRRLYAIQETISRVSNGNTLARTALTGSDEAAVLANEFNKMLDEIASRDSELLDANRLLHNELTERQHAEECLQRERTLLRCIIDSVDDLIFIKDINSVYLGCNKASEALIGLAESAQIGKTDFDFFPEEKAEAIRRADQEVLNSKKPLKIEEWVEYPDGRKQLIETRKIPFFGPDGEIMGLVGICRDITERKQAEEAIQDAHQVFRTLVENSPDIIARYDRNCRRTYVNPAYLKTAQISEEMLLTKAPV
ncbi:MAG: PAS domain S-box protein, partial [Geobacter sp.]|nr:PAS domain S-box protein [Geobacter sp.]